MFRFLVGRQFIVTLIDFNAIYVQSTESEEENLCFSFAFQKYNIPTPKLGKHLNQTPEVLAFFIFMTEL